MPKMTFEKHDGGSSITQESEKVSGQAKKTYRDGANVHKGDTPKDPKGQSPASQPHKQTY